MDSVRDEQSVLALICSLRHCVDQSACMVCSYMGLPLTVNMSAASDVFSSERLGLFLALNDLLPTNASPGSGLNSKLSYFFF